MSYNPREIGWVDSSDSEPGEELEEMRDLENYPNPRSPPPTRDARGPIMQVHPQTIEENRDYWAHCLIGELIDVRQFLVRRLQHALNHAWRLQGRVTVVGREDNTYVIHFERMEDLYYIHAEDPWSIHGALFHLINWRPNLVLTNLAITEVPLWIQIWGLPLEYQIPQVARKLAQIAGDIMEVDWAPVTPRNIRFMRVRVMVPINKPLVMGLLLRLDNEIHVWIRFRYERIFKFCRSCGRIGHTYPRCDWLRDYASTVITEQMASIRDELGVEMGIQPSRIHFVNEARAFVNRDHRMDPSIILSTLLRWSLSSIMTPDAMAATTVATEVVSTSEEDPEEEEDFLILPFHNQIPELEPGDMEVVWEEEPTLQDTITDLPELNDADPEIQAMAEMFSLNKPHQCLFPLPGVRLTDHGVLAPTNEFPLRWVELEPGEFGLTNAKFDWELPQSEDRMMSYSWWDMKDIEERDNPPTDIFMIGEHSDLWTPHRPWKNSTFERGESSSANASLNGNLPSQQTPSEGDELALVVQPFLRPLTAQGSSHVENSEGSNSDASLTQEEVAEINSLSNENLTVMGAEMGFWVADDAPQEVRTFQPLPEDNDLSRWAVWQQGAAGIEHNSYWLAPIRQLTDVNTFDNFPILVQAGDHIRVVETSKKRRFDSIEDLRTEMIKKAKSEPIVINMMGHLKRKKTCTSQSYLHLEVEKTDEEEDSEPPTKRRTVITEAQEMEWECLLNDKIRWSGFEYVDCVDPRGKSGGLGLCWTKSINLTILEKTINWIHGTGIDKSGQQFVFTAVYGPPKVQDRHILWTYLHGKNEQNLPWIIFGDFNQIRGVNEKLSRCSSSHGCVDFDNFINQHTLVEIPSKGAWFTWSNNRLSEDVV
ncbi:Pyruvate carboxyltransferase [Senna tora]|uniref:Pyruvate carboxyltransferase n=1 Tax=Senna tora TaxID=362788 RepID=A0A835C6S2_9FABA|nr:Pyruvate carboxyltransferase [Senna tora]